MRDVFCLSRKCSHSAWMDIPFFSFARHNAWHGQLGGSLLVKRTPNTYRRRPPVNVHVNLSMLNYNTPEMNDKDAKINYFFFTIAHRIRRTSFDKIRSQNLLRCAPIENDNFFVPERFCTGIAMTHFMQLSENVEFEDLALLSSSATFFMHPFEKWKSFRESGELWAAFSDSEMQFSFHFNAPIPFRSFKWSMFAANLCPKAVKQAAPVNVFSTTKINVRNFLFFFSFWVSFWQKITRKMMHATFFAPIVILALRKCTRLPGAKKRHFECALNMPVIAVQTIIFIKFVNFSVVRITRQKS